MSQRYLKDISVVLPSGFTYKDEDTGTVLTSHNFNGLLAKAIQHRATQGLPSDATLIDKIEKYLCKNNPEEYCTDKARGLGDLVHSIAQPIARVIDQNLGTNIKGCWSCASRRKALNKAVAFRH